MRGVAGGPAAQLAVVVGRSYERLEKERAAREAEENAWSHKLLEVTGVERFDLRVVA